MQSFQLHERATSRVADSDTQQYNVKDWQKGYQSLNEEFEYFIESVEGEIPVDLEGTLFRNGPGRLDVNGQRVHHPFDGDGMISAIAFSQGRAHFRNRFVRTDGFLAEQKAGRILHRGVFGTQKPGGWLANAFDFQLKNIANTQVIYWGGKLLALWEAAEPHRLDPHTLETIGREYLDGVLQPGSAFAAHPWVDPACQMDGGAPCLVNFAIKPGLSTTITLYELNPAGQVLRQHAHAVPGFAFIHDFAITPNYGIFFQNPVSFNPLPFVLGLRGAAECISFRPGHPTQIVIIPRHGSEPVQIIPADSGFVFHHANAFEQDGQLFVDSICYPAFPAVEPNQDYQEVKFSALPPGQLWRFQLNLQTRQVQSRMLEGRCCEFPAIHSSHVGRPYRYLYLGAAAAAEGNAPLQAILKVDLETGDRQIWSAAPRGYVSEPVFVPRSPSAYREGLPSETYDGAEDNGWLLTLVYDAAQEQTNVVILDAADLNRGAIATLHLKHHIPYGLHGTFTPEYFGKA
ncbi:carotenoid oxygenase family protein [Oculatella sp. LEGE 06141]|uniref:carotenoid oxygenase family protein n=1 Tax=Oculatella sp. LEGE 06141 TaxID=1828648 RepID=UPI00187FCD37|nr:carotenoid oxygenase family protein [Oculatella sp. LEGE 06141]MBE9181649.1 carotenoid oxygenase family protein [Oculatella sp. LEGE 06141]